VIKSVLSAVAVTTALTGAAFAADLVIEAPAEMVVDSSYDWSGFYIGVHGGYGAGIAEQLWDLGVVDDPATEDVDIDIDGWLLGGHIGANFQSGSLVGGVEALLDYAPLGGSDGGTDGDDNAFDAEWLATFGGRVGFASDQALFYLSGGVAVLSGVGSVLDVGEEEEVDYSFVGGTVGAGVEFAIDENISARLDYRYYAFGESVEYFPINGYSEGFTPSFHTITAGLSMGF
jgi:outer membrane immunogenic protein